MSILLTKMLWYRWTEGYKVTRNITDSINLTLGKGVDIQNNILSFSVKNAHSNYVDSNNEIKFEEQDQIKFYVKYTDDGADIESTTWSLTSTTEPAEADLAGVFYVIEFSPKHTTNKTVIQVKTADKTYILFNKVLARTFTKDGDQLTAPEAIQKIIRFSCQVTKSDDQIGGFFRGTGSDSGVFYQVDARLASQDGYITNTRDVSNSPNSSTEFPKMGISLVWKPIYEWINELSQIEKINESYEIAGETIDNKTYKMVYGRPFIFWIDEKNRFHWVYPSDSTTDYLEVGTVEGGAISYDATKTNDATIHDVNIVKRVFDVTNMLIYNAGVDMYKTGMWGYEVDVTSRVKSLKMRVVPMTDIAKSALDTDYKEGYMVAADREGTPAGQPKWQFPTDANYAKYDAGTAKCIFCENSTTYSTAGSINSDSNYNDALWEHALFLAKIRAQTILKALGHARWKGTITTKGKLFTVGNLVEVTDTSIGLYKQKMRIMDLQHTIDTRGWFTQIDLEQDPEVVEVKLT